MRSKNPWWAEAGAGNTPSAHRTMSSQVVGPYPQYPHLGPEGGQAALRKSPFPNYRETAWGCAPAQRGSGGKGAGELDQWGLGGRDVSRCWGVREPGLLGPGKRGGPGFLTSETQRVGPDLLYQGSASRPLLARYKRAGYQGERAGARVPASLTMSPALQLALLGTTLMLSRE